MNSFIADYTFIFLIAIISIVGVIALRTFTLFLVQLFLLGSMIFINTSSISGLSIAISVVQGLFSLFLIYKVIKAIDRFYILTLEKTHMKDPQHIKGSDYGSQSSFL